MRLLLDTHVLLWWLSDDTRLGAPARAAVAHPRNEAFVSALSLAEIATKQSVGKLWDPFDRLLIAQALEEGLTIVTADPSFGPYGVPVLAA